MPMFVNVNKKTKDLSKDLIKLGKLVLKWQILFGVNQCRVIHADMKPLEYL